MAAGLSLARSYITWVAMLGTQEARDRPLGRSLRNQLAAEGNWGLILRYVCKFMRLSLVGSLESSIPATWTPGLTIPCSPEARKPQSCPYPTMLFPVRRKIGTVIEDA